MTFSVPSEDYKVSPKIVRAMDRFFTLHADHEQNASTSTVRLAGSSGANPFACIAAGIASLWGCLLYTSPSPRDRQKCRMPSSA